METFKVNSSSDNETFIKTVSYRNLYNKLKGLKSSRGRIIHVVGAPGTGKSANIHASMMELDLKFYDVKLHVTDRNAGADELLNQIYTDMKLSLGSKSKSELFQDLAGYHALLIADSFHDSHLLNNKYIGYSLWTKNNGISSLKFYFLCINEYVRNRKYYKEINLIFQTAWRVKIGKKKYDSFFRLRNSFKVRCGFDEIIF